MVSTPTASELVKKELQNLANHLSDIYQDFEYKMFDGLFFFGENETIVMTDDGEDLIKCKLTIRFVYQIKHQYISKLIKSLIEYFSKKVDNENPIWFHFSVDFGDCRILGVKQ